MDTATTLSKNGILIRLTEERWKHIVLMHPGLIGKQTKVLTTVKNPDYILKGGARELLAVSAPYKVTRCGTLDILRVFESSRKSVDV